MQANNLSKSSPEILQELLDEGGDLLRQYDLADYLDLEARARLARIDADAVRDHIVELLMTGAPAQRGRLVGRFVNGHLIVERRTDDNAG